MRVSLVIAPWQPPPDQAQYRRHWREIAQAQEPKYSVYPIHQSNA